MIKKNMKIFIFLFVIHLISCFVYATADRNNDGDSDKGKDRSGRLAFSTNRLPLSPDYQNKFYNPGYLEYGYNKPDRYDHENSLTYDVPSSFDQFVPDKSSDKYTYGAGGIYLPYSPKTKTDYIMEEIEGHQDNGLQPKESPTKEMKVLTGTPSSSSAVEVEDKPTFLSVIRKFFTSPVVIAVAIIPLLFLVPLLFPNISSMFGNLSLLPEVTTTIATGVARRLEGEIGTLSVDRVLDVINEYGARSMDDPRCFQRYLCQAAKSGIESRSGDSWSVQKAIQKLAKSVDDRLWDAMGLKHLFNSIVNGNCDRLKCTGSLAYSTSNLPLLEKLSLLKGKLFPTTEVIQ